MAKFEMKYFNWKNYCYKKNDTQKVDRSSPLPLPYGCKLVYFVYSEIGGPLNTFLAKCTLSNKEIYNKSLIT